MNRRASRILTVCAAVWLLVIWGHSCMPAVQSGAESGALLTDRQRQMLRLRVEEDLSLSEIAESCGVSRQAVHDALRKAENTLDDTEKKLGAVRRYRALRSDAGRAMDALDAGDTALARRILADMQKEGVYGV